MNGKIWASTGLQEVKDTLQALQYDYECHIGGTSDFVGVGPHVTDVRKGMGTVLFWSTKQFRTMNNDLVVLPC